MCVVGKLRLMFGSSLENESMRALKEEVEELLQEYDEVMSKVKDEKEENRVRREVAKQLEKISDDFKTGRI